MFGEFKLWKEFSSRGEIELINTGKTVFTLSLPCEKPSD
jgi:hypothetical protein